MSTDFQNPRASARGAVKAADNPMQADAFNVKMADLIVRHRRSNGGIPGISDGGMHVGKHDIKAFELGPMVAAIGMRPDEISEPQVNIVGPSVVPVAGMSSLRRLAAAMPGCTERSWPPTGPQQSPMGSLLSGHACNPQRQRRRQRQRRHQMHFVQLVCCVPIGKQRSCLTVKSATIRASKKVGQTAPT